MNTKNILCYLGSCVIIAALIWFMLVVAEVYFSAGILILSIIYVLLFLFFAQFLWKKDKKIASGLLNTLAVCFIPVLMWSVFDCIGTTSNLITSPIVRISLYITEVSTAALGIFLLVKKRFPLLTVPVSVALWCFSMDIAPLFTGHCTEPSIEMRKFATFIFALVILFVARMLDRKEIKTLSSWFYVIGATSMWAMLVWVFSVLFNAEFGEFGEFLLAFFAFEYIFLSIILKRKIFVFWGMVGIFGYIAHLGSMIFNTPFTFPVLLIILGVLIILYGIYYDEWYKKLDSILGKYISIK